MWNIFKILFYIARDTIYRWCTNASSPISRLCVVFFLSICGLIFLSNFVISVKVLKGRIQHSGADLILVSEFINNKAQHSIGKNIFYQDSAPYDLFIFHEAFCYVNVGLQQYPLIEYLPCCTKLFPPTERNSMFILPSEPAKNIIPTTVELDNFNLQAVSIPESEAGILRRLHQNGAVFIPYGNLTHIWEDGFIRHHVMQMKTPTPHNILKQENIIRQLARLDNRNYNIVSSGSLLSELSQLEKSQYFFRVWVSIGISLIICLLLTNISFLEFRQNRYVYALIGSFGINRGILFLGFIIENALLVFFAFGTSVALLWHIKNYITSTLFKAPEITLQISELGDDIRTFLLAFGISIIVSGIPIGIAACRPIGKVLK